MERDPGAERHMSFNMSSSTVLCTLSVGTVICKLYKQPMALLFPSSSLSLPISAIPQFKDKATCLPDRLVTWPQDAVVSHGIAPLCLPGLLDEWMDERMDEYITKHFRGMDVFGNVGGSCA